MHTRELVRLVLGCSALYWAPAVSQVRAQDSLWAVYAGSGAEAQKKGKYKEAAELFEKAVAEIDQSKVRNASAIEAHTNLGRCYEQLSRYGDAERVHGAACTRAREHLAPADPVAVEAAYQLAQLYARRGNDEQALVFAEWLESVVRNEPKASRAHSGYDLIADVHIRAKRYEKAAATYDAALVHATTQYRLRGYFLGELRRRRANLELLRDRPAAAAKEFLTAAEQYATDLEDDHLRGNTMDAASYWDAAIALVKAKDQDAADAAYQKAEQGYEAHLRYFAKAKGRLSEPAGVVRYRLVSLDEARERYGDAERRLKQFLDLTVDEKGSGSAEAAEVQFRISAFHARRKDPVEAEKWLRVALADREATAGKDSPDLAACLNRLAGFLSDGGKHEEAERLLRRNLANCRAGGDGARRAVAEACKKLAFHLEHHGAKTECSKLLREALGIFERLDGESSRSVADALDDLVWHAEQRDVRVPLARRAKAIIEATGYRDGRYKQAVNTLGNALRHHGDYGEAMDCFRLCLALELDWAPSTSTSSYLHNNIGICAEALDRFDESVAESLKAVDPKRTEGDRKYTVAKYHANLAGAYYRVGKFEEAEKMARKAFEVRDGDSGKESTVLAASLGQLAALEAHRGGFATAEGLLDRATVIRKRYVRENEQEARVANLFESAWRHHHHGRWAEAEKDLAELSRLATEFKLPEVSEAIFSSLAGTYWAHLADAWELRGRVALGRGDLVAAEEHFRLALATHEKYHKDTSRHATALLWIARCDAARGDLDAAAERTGRAVEMLEKLFGKGHAQTAGAVELAAELDLRRGREGATKALAAVLAIREKDPTGRPALLRTRVLAAEAEARFGDAAAAAKRLDELTAAHGELYGKEHYGRHGVLFAAAEAWARAGDKERAADRYKESLAVRVRVFGKDHDLSKSCGRRMAEVTK